MAPDVWVRDVGAGQVSLVSVNAAGNATGNDGSFAPAISADGNRVAFASSASNLVVGRRRQRRHPGRVRARRGDRDDLAREPHRRSERDLGQRRLGAGVDRRVRDADRVRDVRERSRARRRRQRQRRTCCCATRSRTRPSSSAARRASTAPRPPSRAGPRASPATATAWRSRRPRTSFVAMPPGTDHLRVVARAAARRLPVRAAGRRRRRRPARRRAAGDRPTPRAPVLSRRQHRAAPLPRRASACQAAHAQAAGDRGAAALHALGGGDRDDPDRRAAAGAAAEASAASPPRRAPRGRACTRAVRRGTLTRAGERRREPRHDHRPPARQAAAAGPYRATLKAKDAAGNVSARRRVGFTVLRPT